MNRINYTIAFLWNFIYAVIRKIVGRRRFRRYFYYGKRIKGMPFVEEYIYHHIVAGRPFLVARFGDAELRTVKYTIEYNLGFRKVIPDYIKEKMQINAGFFPTDDESMYAFGNMMIESSKQVDMFATWYNQMEDYVIHHTAKSAELCIPEYIDPFRSDHPWTRALAGKKVLVVHPFAQSIQKQYAIKEKLYDNKDMLPDFELITYKAAQTQARAESEFSTWFEALDKMFNDIKKLDFDIAIIGCGAYGFPLAARIKSLGKQAIHLGGATQILFGIKGARWDVRPEVNRLFNEYWIRPSENERPKGAEKVEGGCYW